MTENKSWKCKGVSEEKNGTVYVLAWLTFMSFWFFTIFLLISSFASVIGLETIDLGARLSQFWNPWTNPFVWVLIVLASLSLILFVIAASIRKACLK